MSEASCRCGLVDPEEATAPLISGLLNDVVELKREVRQLRDVLSGFHTVEQAKGMLMLAYGHGPRRASGILANWAMEFGVSKHTVAQRMIEAAGTPVSSAESEVGSPAGLEVVRERQPVTPRA